MNKYVLVLWAATAAAVSAATNTAPAAPARAPVQTGMNDYVSLAIWAAVVLGIFGFLWRKGYLEKIRNYVSETNEELRKCTWPSREELKGSTVVVMITILMLGLFTISVDWVLSMVMGLIT